MNHRVAIGLWIFSLFTVVTTGASIQRREIGRRDYYVYLPSSLRTSAPTATFIILHGSGVNAQTTLPLYNLIPKAEAEGFILIAPNASLCPEGVAKGQPYWNSGIGKTCPQSTADDVKFITDVIADLPRAFKVQVDAKKIYVAGHSGGAIMAYRMACEASDKIAAVAAVEGAYGPQLACPMAQPVSVLAFHGTGDTSLPYESGSSVTECLVKAAATDRFAAMDSGYCYRAYSAPQTADVMAAINQCSRNATLQRFPALKTGNMEVPERVALTYADCRGNSAVQFNKIANGNADNLGAHFFWPNYYTDLIWQFFMEHPK